MSHLKKQIAAARKRGDLAAVRRMEAIERREAMGESHPGFEAVSGRIARRTNPRTGKPYGEERARAIVAASARKASAGAKARNPNLKKVGGA